MVYVPAHPVPQGARRDDTIEFEVRVLADGARVLPVFSTVERMTEALGPAQPWARVPLRAARAVMAVAGIDMFVLDPQFTDDTWRWDARQLRQLVEATA